MDTRNEAYDDGQEEIRFGELVIDRRRRSVTVAGTTVHLTAAEYALLVILASRPGTAVSRRELLQDMWGGEWQADTAALNVHASRLRHKLGESGSEPNRIRTVHGFGYRFDGDAPDLLEEAPVPLEGVDDATATVLIDLQRVIEWVSPEITALLGWRPEQLIGRRFYDLLHPDHVGTALSARSELDAGTGALMVFPLRTVSGDHRAVDASVQPIKGRDGTTVSFLARWSAHQVGAAERADDLFSTTRSQGNLVVLTFDRSFIVRTVEPHHGFLGWDPDRIVGTFFSPTGLDRQTMQDIVSALIASGQHTVVGNIPVRSASGQVHVLPVASHILVDEDGVFAGMETTLYIPDDQGSPAGAAVPE